MTEGVTPSPLAPKEPPQRTPTLPSPTPSPDNAPPPRRRWPMLLGALFTVAMLVGLGRELFGDGLAGLTRAVPSDGRFYLVFAALYAVPQVADFAVFRRLWALPWSGLVALTQKRIANDVLVGYSGEAYFYAWARARRSVTGAPFAAVKDAAIMSAMAGNAVTLAVTLAALPYLRPLLSPALFAATMLSLGVVCATSLPFLLFSRRVFALPRTELWRIFAIYVARLVVGSLLLALAWHFALPRIGAGDLLLLSAGRLLASRLPFVPNKDLLFANFAILLIRDDALTGTIAFTAALTLVVHVVLIAGFALWQIWRQAVGWRARARR